MRITPIIFISEVPGFKGKCKPTWLNQSGIHVRLDGGQTGFFKLLKKNFLGVEVKIGKEFHGIIQGRKIISTRGLGL